MDFDTLSPQFSTFLPSIQNSHTPYNKFHVESCCLLKPPLPQLDVELVSWYITKSCFSVVHNIELGGGEGGEGETKFVLSMFNNFVILAGMVSRVLSKIKAVTLEPKAKCPLFKTRGSIKWFPVCLSFDIAVRMSQS